MADATIQNDPTKPGQLAAPKEVFGPYSRYAIAPVHTRFDEVQWFVWDAHQQDEHFPTFPRIVRQEPTREAALADLDMADPFEGFEGQDRDSYSDDQDREGYSLDGETHDDD